MINVDIINLDKKREENLKKYGIDKKTIEKYKAKIKDKGNKIELSKELYTLISSKSFNDTNNINEVTSLILRGADLNYHNEKKGDFPLLICCRKGYFNTFILLVKFGADINNKNNYGTTATMASARHGYEEMLKLLIQMGANIDARCIDKDNALDSAIKHNEENCIKLLKDASCITALYECELEQKITYKNVVDQLDKASKELELILKKQITN